MTAAGPPVRVGIGTDVHRLVDGVPMRLAGLAWPDEPQGLDGHSDGDVAAHAACDALLSAAGLGDLAATSVRRIRRGPARPAWRCSPRPPRGCARPATRSATSPSRSSATGPRLGPRRAEAEAALRRAVGAPVSVSATTTDGLGLTGRGEGVAAIATALVLAPEPGSPPPEPAAGRADVVPRPPVKRSELRKKLPLPSRVRRAPSDLLEDSLRGCRRARRPDTAMARRPTPVVGGTPVSLAPRASRAPPTAPDDPPRAFDDRRRTSPGRQALRPVSPGDRSPTRRD